MVKRSVVGEGLVRDISDQDAVVANAKARLRLDGADDGGVESPLGEDGKDLVFPALFGYQEHAFLALGEHDFIAVHVGFALGDVVELDIEADAAARTHFAGGASEAGCAHVLNADDGTGLHGFKASLEEKLFHEGVADLDVGALRFSALVEFFTGHGCAVNTVAAGFRSDIDDGVADAGGFAVEDFVDADHAKRESVDQRIAAVAGLEFGFAAEVGDTKAVAVARDAADYALDDGVIFMG